jgi:hypothetical protein
MRGGGDLGFGVGGNKECDILDNEMFLTFQRNLLPPSSEYFIVHK